jgi:hypothetical protein
MAWEFVQNRGTGSRHYGEAWKTLPSVSISKTGFAVNVPFMQAFGLKPGLSIMVGFDSDRRKIGFKVCTDTDSCALGFRLTEHKCQSGYCSYRIGHERLTKRFPDAIGHIYRAHLNPNERIIEVQISPENMV